MEVKIIAASEAAKKMICLTRMCREITVENGRPMLKIDNMSTVKLVKNQRSKRIGVRNLFKRELYETNAIAINHVGCTDQLAEILINHHQGFVFKRYENC